MPAEQRGAVPNGSGVRRFVGLGWAGQRPEALNPRRKIPMESALPKPTDLRLPRSKGMVVGFWVVGG